MTSQDRGQDINCFWSILQEELSIEIPEFIINILKAYSYSSASMVRLIDEPKITEIEKFVQEDLLYTLEDTNFNKRDYYNVFHNNPKNFRFFGGQRDILKQLSECINNKIKELGNVKKGLMYFHKKESTKELPKRKITMNPRLGGDNGPQAPREIQNQDVQVDNIEINKQSSLLLQKLKTSLKAKKFSEDVSILLFQISSQF